MVVRRGDRRLVSAILILFLFVLIFIFSVGSVLAVDAVELFSDEFSSNHPLDTGWEGEYTGAPNSSDLDSDIFTDDDPELEFDGFYMVTRDTAAAIISVNTVGFEDIVLSYYRTSYPVEVDHDLIIEWRVGDSGNWSEIERFNPADEGWEQNVFSFPDSANGQEEVQVRFYLDLFGGLC
jgi:hypothetical protein